MKKSQSDHEKKRRDTSAIPKSTEGFELFYTRCHALSLRRSEAVALFNFAHNTEHVAPLILRFISNDSAIHPFTLLGHLDAILETLPGAVRVMRRITNRKEKKK